MIMVSADVKLLCAVERLVLLNEFLQILWTLSSSRCRWSCPLLRVISDS